MSEPMSPRDKTEAALRRALTSATGAPLLPLPKNTVQHLAKHLANALVPSWLHKQEAETAGEEIAHVLLMVGLFPPDWVNAHAAEVRLEDAGLIEDAACDADFTHTPDYCAGLRAAGELLTRLATGEKATGPAAERLPKADVVAWLVKKAREYRAAGTREDRARADVMASLASKISRGAVRPDNLRMLPDPGFFEADHTYTRGYWTFQCLAVEPITWANRETRAVGFLTRRDGTGTVTGLDPDDWTHGGWTDTTNDTTTGDPA